MRPLEIQNVVEEVTRRVIALSDSASTHAVGDVAEPNESKITVIDGKVISTQQLNNLPDDLTAVQISSKSLVTPAAADWLRERNIDVRRVDVQAYGEAGNTVDSRDEWACLTVGGNMEGSQSFDCIVKASRRCNEAISNGNRVVLVTDSTAVALIALNRSKNLRAVEVRSINQLEGITSVTYANVFVICKNSAQSNRLIKQIKTIPQQKDSPPEWL
ncbi:MAG: hypothetical protein HOB73_08030 [Planctomycetaceae bacterium]|jgi:hypothetical protein|nr:hypothetical protein [Planctomycetaceae bacterium]